MPHRTILHIDLDAFYASVEQRDDPSLRGRPVAVGGRRRGVVMAASYEARAFGVRSAMPTGEARRRCPDLLIIKPRFDAYKAASAAVYALFPAFAAAIEPAGIDEAYLDISSHAAADGPRAVAEALRTAVRREVRLTASVGVAPNKFLAKVASAFDKPDGLTVVRPEEARAFIAALPIERFRGVGPRMAARLRRDGIETGADLQHRGRAALVRAYGRFGHRLAAMAAGEDDRPVRAGRHRKSIGKQRTYGQNLRGADALEGAVSDLAAAVSTRMGALGLAARTVTLTVRRADFTTVTRRATPVGPPIADEARLRAVALGLLHRPLPPFPVRLLGVTVSGLMPRVGPGVGRQLALPFGPPPGDADIA